MVKLIGSREEVWNGRAKQTIAGLKKHDYVINSKGRLVSWKLHCNGKIRVLLWHETRKWKKRERVLIRNLQFVLVVVLVLLVVVLTWFSLYVCYSS